MVEFLERLWPAVVGILTVVLSVITSAHVILHKRDVRAAAGWTALVWLAPIVGPGLYALLGINRIRRRATELRQGSLIPSNTEELRASRAGFEKLLPPEGAHLPGLAQLVDRVTGIPLTCGNTVELLVNGDAAFPAMLDAINSAKSSVALGTYIFDNDAAGQMFVDALAQAVGRGVQVRVLIDSVGARYSWPPIIGTLRQRGVPVQRFLHSVYPWRMPYLNLRSHRKIVVVDGRVGFTGGMNVRIGHMLQASPGSPVQDLHFRLRGPVVAQLMSVFADDWMFAARERLAGEMWFPRLEEVGTVAARGIPDGPDEDLDKLRWTILGALASAKRSIVVMTPYFLPDQTIITSINLAAMRGVRVQVVLPQKNNLPFVHWAATHQLWQMLRRGCEFVMTAPPFDHTKIMVVDDVWSLIGSANWDPRSLRLNFEYDVECYDAELARQLTEHVREKVAGGRMITLAQMNGRPLLVRLRDGIARLASPYM